MNFQRSGLQFLSLRAGIYTDAFPLYLNWYPSSTNFLLPKLEPPVSQGKIAFTSRDELGEGIAVLIAKGGPAAFPSIVPRTDKNIILLTGANVDSLEDMAHALVEVQKVTELPVEWLEADQWIEASAKDDVGGKQRGWFEARLKVFEGFCKGEAEVVDSALEVLLGRRPERGVDGVRRLGSLGIRIMLRGDRGFCLGVLHRTFRLVECNISLVLVCFSIY
jgi:hypothetical protein